MFIKVFELVGKDFVGVLDIIVSKFECFVEGDLSNGFSVEVKGEFREVLEDLRDIIYRFKGLIGEIVNVMNELDKRVNVFV